MFHIVATYENGYPFPVSNFDENETMTNLSISRDMNHSMTKYQYAIERIRPLGWNIIAVVLSKCMSVWDQTGFTHHGLMPHIMIRRKIVLSNNDACPLRSHCRKLNRKPAQNSCLKSSAIKSEWCHHRLGLGLWDSVEIKADFSIWVAAKCWEWISNCNFIPHFIVVVITQPWIKADPYH